MWSLSWPLILLIWGGRRFALFQQLFCAEHCDRPGYHHFAAHMTGAGYAVVAMDHQGPHTPL